METFTCEVLAIAGTQFTVRLTGSEGTKYETVFQAEGIAELKQLVNALTARLNNRKTKAAVGPLDISAPQPIIVAPTPAELDQQAFLVLLRDWQQKKSALGVSKTVTQQDVDDAYAAMKAAYIDAYAQFLVGVL